MTSTLTARALASVAHRAIAPPSVRRSQWRHVTLVVLAALITGAGTLGGTWVLAPIIGQSDIRYRQQAPPAAVAAAPPSAVPRPGTAPVDSADRREVSHRLGVNDAREHEEPAPTPMQGPAGDGRDAPDPFILQDGGEYALYTSQVGLHSVPVATSRDLVHGSEPRDALPTLPPWAAWGWTWAPAVLRRGDRYVLYFAARSGALGIQCIGAAVATSAIGPFTSRDEQPLVCQRELGGSIDPYTYATDDGAAYLLWKSDGNALGRASTLHAQRLRRDGLALEGTAVDLLDADAPWEQPLIENPALIAGADLYYLFYSGGWWESAGYAIGYAVCDTPLGPCRKATTTEPLLSTAGDEAGPGGASVVITPSGEQWLAYHAWAPGSIGYAKHGLRTLRFASLSWRDAVPAVTRSPPAG
jgi:beta-xylosidase